MAAKKYPTGGLSTPEKLVSKNPAVRKEGEREATAGDIVKASRLSGGNQIETIRSISERAVSAQSGGGGSSYTPTGQESIKITDPSTGQSKTITNLRQDEAEAVAASQAERKRIEAIREYNRQIQEENLKRKQVNNQENVIISTGPNNGNVTGNFSIYNGDMVLDQASNTLSEAEKPKDFGEKLSRKASEIEFKRQFRETDPFKKQLYGIESFTLGAAAGAYNLLRHPIQSIKGSFELGKSLIKDPYGTGYQIGEQIQQEPSKFIGEQIGAYIAVKGALEIIPKYTKNLYIKVGATEIPTEQVFAKSVLEGKEKLPTSNSIIESIESFQETKQPVLVEKKVGNNFVPVPKSQLAELPFNVPEKIYASTASPSKISGTVAEVGKKAAKGYEDPGIYVTPKGKASPYFLRLSAEGYEYSFDPITAIKQKFGIPTITEFAAENILLYPREVISKPGFEEIFSFQESQAGSGNIFITKRSEIGQGTIPRQKFFNPISKKIEFELGTSEIEAVIPIKQEFKAVKPGSFLGKIKGFEEFTLFEGKPVAIRKADLVVLDEAPTGKPLDIISLEKVAKEQRALSSQLTSEVSSGAELSLALVPSKSSESLFSFDVLEFYTPGSEGSSSLLPELSSGSSAPTKSSSSQSVLSDLSSSAKSGSLSSSGSSSGLSFPVSSINGRSGAGSSDRSRGFSGGGSSGGRVPGLNIPTRKTKSDSDDEEEEKKGLFEIQVRRGGLFKTIGTAEDLKRAVLLGRSRVEETAAASFKIKGIDQVEDLSKIQSYLPRKKFYQSEKEAGVFIQKNKFRISSAGEKGEITYKGIFASKSKKKRRGVF